MPLPDLPFNDQLAEFGMPWHGLFVRPAGGTGADEYIRLASGRIIPRPLSGPGASNFWSTYLVDRNMPAVQMLPEDPEGEFWRVAIGSFTGTGLSVWGNVRARNTVRVGASFAEADLNISVIPEGTASNPRHITIFSFQAPAAGVSVSFLDLGIPDSVVTSYSFGFSVRYLDVSPDGRRFLCELQASGFTSIPTPGDPNYIIDLRENQPTVGTYAIFEVAFSEDLTALTVTPIAGYEECFEGVIVSSVDGAPYEWGRASRIVNVNEVTLDFRPYSPTGDYPGLPPACGAGVGEPCVWTSTPYTKGVSEAVSVRETVVGAWYGPDTNIELVRVRTESRVRGNYGDAVLGPGDRYFIETFTRTHTISASIQRGDGAWAAIYEFSARETQSETGRTYSLELDGTPVRTSSVPWGGDLEGNDAGMLNPESAHDLGARFELLFSSWGVSILVVGRVGWRASNKVIGSLTRLLDEGEQYCEYVAGPALTPSGMDEQVMRTGNVWAGCRNPMPDDSPPDQAVARYHRNFQHGAYNPVTGETLRNQTGGDQYTWV